MQRGDLRHTPKTPEDAHNWFREEELNLCLLLTGEPFLPLNYRGS